MLPNKNLRWWWLYYHFPQYGWFTGQLSGPQHNQIAPAYSEPIELVTVDSTSSSFTSISKISISLGVRPLDLLLGLRPWTPLGDFRPPEYLPLCVNPPPSPQRYRSVDATGEDMQGRKDNVGRWRKWVVENWRGKDVPHLEMGFFWQP